MVGKPKEVKGLGVGRMGRCLYCKRDAGDGDDVCFDCEVEIAEQEFKKMEKQRGVMNE